MVGTRARILAVYDPTVGSGGFLIYVNGTLIIGPGGGTTTISAGVVDPLRIGGGGGLGAWYQGLMSRVAIYNRVLTAAENTQHQAALDVTSAITGPNGSPTLDAFNRADQDPVTNGTNWFIEPGQSGLRVVGNRVTGRPAGANGQSTWNLPVGPAFESFFKIATRPLEGESVYVSHFLSGFNTAAKKTYFLQWTVIGGNDRFQIKKYDGTAVTQLGADILQNVVVDDALAFVITATDVVLYRKPLNGAWAVLGTRAETANARTADGRIQLEIQGETTKIDQFGGLAQDSAGFSRRHFAR